ncbi:MAG: tetratricopeptide repeat protein [Geobacteraceae bacterium]|nr:tetratricopeptide repeat protein [Geobacteraceae bacterium]
MESYPEKMDRRGGLRDTAILVAAIVLAYLNSGWGGYQFDDFGTIVTNSNVHSWWAWLHKSISGGIRPLLNFSYMLNWISGMGSNGFHLINGLVHLLSTLLVYRIAGCFVEGCQRQGCEIERTELIPLFSALIFAVHPVQTEAVTYISGRSSSLMSMFYLASMLAYIHGARSESWKWVYITSPVLFVSAVATKEVAMSLPLALLLWERVVNRTPWGTAFRRQAFHWLLLALLPVLFVTHPRYGQLLLFSIKIRSFQDTLVSQVNGITYLMGQLVRVGSMNIDPDVSRFTGGSAVYLATLIGAWGVAAVYAFRKARHKPWYAFGLLWFAVAMFPSNSIVPRTDVVNERHLYLANLGIFICFVTVVLNLKLAELNVPLIGALVCLLAGFTFYRNMDYRSETALWEQTARFSPAKSRVFNNLGCAYESAGHFDKAATAYARAISLQPDNRVAAGNVKRLNLLANRLNGAIN